ncbi:MAG: hypothetical protein K0Q72_4823 [Armatimonadetes bacterium]|nr:hypothetical protein [Armatimonadota bacterium]
MNGLDLSLFQFDYDQTLSALFLNADGTVYGRFGTRAGNGPKSTTHVSLASFGKAMERALALHREYPKNRAQLAAKRGPAPEYRTANQIPGLEKRPARVAARNDGCIHCHQVREEPLRQKWSAGTLKPADLWVYPLPENTGMKLAVDDGLRVASVLPGSPAARAGVQPGDELRTLEGQPLLSQADVQWVLNRAPDTATLRAEVLRGGQTRPVTLSLSGEWKKTDLSWRPSSGPGLRWGVWSSPLSAEDRAKLGVPADGIGLQVKNLYLPRAAPAQQAGLRVGDVILAADGKTGFANEGELLAYLRLTHGPGNRAALTVLRSGQRLELAVPMW